MFEFSLANKKFTFWVHSKTTNSNSFMHINKGCWLFGLRISGSEYNIALK